jgi:hypothetical protein
MESKHCNSETGRTSEAALMNQRQKCVWILYPKTGWTMTGLILTLIIWLVREDVTQFFLIMPYQLISILPSNLCLHVLRPTKS